LDADASECDVTGADAVNRTFRKPFGQDRARRWENADSRTGTVAERLLEIVRPSDRGRLALLEVRGLCSVP
jgi:hypothetical protein